MNPIKNIKAEVKNNAEQYLKARKSEPAVASILDGMDKNTIDEMEDKIIGEINKNSGFVKTSFDYTLYIAKKV